VAPAYLSHPENKAMLDDRSLARIQRALTEAGLDGWLLYDFRGLNPVAGAMLGIEGMATRRIFALIPATGTPTAITHAIEQGPWQRWPAAWGKEVYSSWRSLESYVAALVRGKRVAMEYSPGDAVPYVDRVPAGVLEMVRAAGAEVVSSAELVTQFYATWTDEELATHRRTAEKVAEIAQQALRHAGAEAHAGRPMTEHGLQQHILAEFRKASLETIEPPVVAVGPNAANPHYEPRADNPVSIREGDLVLLDLWARERGGIWADQTWMASVGEPTPRAVQVWTAVRDARDAAIALLRERVTGRATVRGGEADDAARSVITTAGFGDRFTHRTGHSIDSRDLHGSGPHLDNLETREERLLVPGVAFSIEPGVYIPGEIGVRSEVNAYVGDGELVVTPTNYQRDMMVV
jgi:Xaa-Pro dipeptidase